MRAEPAGNAKGELVLKHLELESGNFFAYQTSRYSWISWRTIFIAVNAIVVVGLIVTIALRKRQ